MEQTDQIVFPGHFLHDFHRQLIVICGDICSRIDRSQLMLSRSHLVVLSLRQNSQFPQLFVQFFHIGSHPWFDSAEIMIIHLLPF